MNRVVKRTLRAALRNLHYFAFPEERLFHPSGTVNCILGEGSIVHPQARIYNPSGCKSNITIGRNSRIVGSLTVWANAGKIEIGDCSFIGEDSRLYSAKHIKIGNRVQIAHGCNIFDCNIHSLEPGERHKEYVQNTTGALVKLFSLEEEEVIIGDDAWLGACVIVLKGVNIGNGVVVGAGTVVTRSIPDYTIAVGNPARFVGTVNRGDNKNT